MKISEFGAKKIGEVLAFAVVGNQTFQKGREGLLKIFDNQKISSLESRNIDHSNKIKEISIKYNIADIVEKKFQATSEKLRTMRDLYDKDDWGNPTEISEWFGFFEGAAIVHWMLVKGIGESINDKELENLADDAIIFHEELLKVVSLILFNTGKERSK